MNNPDYMRMTDATKGNMVMPGKDGKGANPYGANYPGAGGKGGSTGASIPGGGNAQVPGGS